MKKLINPYYFIVNIYDRYSIYHLNNTFEKPETQLTD